jgi:hypothetical protein
MQSKSFFILSNIILTLMHEFRHFTGPTNFAYQGNLSYKIAKSQLVTNRVFCDIEMILFTEN